MALANLVRETISTTGQVTSNIQLSGALDGFKAFSEVWSSDQDAIPVLLKSGDDWAVATATFDHSTDQLDIETVESLISGTAGTTDLTFAAGTQVMVITPASYLAPLESKTAIDKVVDTTANLVDVSIYNTTKDSDGGSWRDKCQHTSWFNETLNTSTRGATRHFPKVALIVAETDTITIYNLDVPDAPMWMVFEATLDYALSQYERTCVKAINGFMVSGGDSASSGNLSIVDFVKDSAFSSRASGSTQRGSFLGDLSQRNEAKGFDLDSSKSIVNSVVSGVAIRALSGAETDPNRCNLPYPTIGVATASGASVINNNGSLANIDAVESITGATLLGMAFVSDTRLILRENGAASSAGPMSFSGPINVTSWRTAVYSALVAPFTLSQGASAESIECGGGAIFISSPNGVTVLEEDTVTPANGMAAHITKDYATGLMQGDVELCLCDGLTDRSAASSTVTDNGIAVIAAVETGAELKKITASGGTITISVTTGGAIYGWELISGVWYFRNNSGWVGVSEASGTLTIADGTTIAWLKYVNGDGPSSAQYTKIEEDEKHLFRENADCLLSGTSNAVADLSYDEDTRKLDVETGDGTSTFIGLKRIDYTDSSGKQTSDTMVAVDRVGDVVAFANDTEVALEKPAGTL